MDVLRRNTDYGLRIMVALAKHSDNGQLISARRLADEGRFSYQLGCKLLQRLGKAKLVKSVMGPKKRYAIHVEGPASRPASPIATKIPAPTIMPMSVA